MTSKKVEIEENPPPFSSSFPSHSSSIALPLPHSPSSVTDGASQSTTLPSEPPPIAGKIYFMFLHYLNLQHSYLCTY